MKKLLALFVLCSAFIFSSVAYAYQPIGVYVGPKLGFAHTKLKDVSLEFDHEYDGDYSFDLGNKNDSGPGFGVVAGYDFSKRFNLPIRADLEVMYYKAEMNRDIFWDLDITPAYGYDIYTDIEIMGTLSMMTNFWFDINLGDNVPVKPYVGASIGAAGFVYDADSRIVGRRRHSKDDVGVAMGFAWGLGGGVSCKLTDRLTADLGYRMIRAIDATHDLMSFRNADLEIEGDFTQQSVALGVRFGF